ncbi:hypothetical protein OEZ85_010521 [Tetradesmus obliquus]|uniref:Uncharacterized protein n=1 Tax=Tetradesmus obliquus TaxID=3088 RepID=A0ABY8TMI2_TETOB|nr:hypothetical protein OEZ85_010521 [Tetradesmus obliquus]
MSMYPALPGDPPRYGYPNQSSGNSGPPPSYPPAQQQLARQASLEHSPWGTETNSTLRVKIADDYKLAPPVPMPPALAASSRPQQDFDYEYERQVMSADASTSIDSFLAKSEDTFYESTKASKFTHAGFSPAVVNLALAYHAAERGDDSQILAFCENFKTLTQEMAFSPALAAGALVKSKNDLAAAANLITELS